MFMRIFIACLLVAICFIFFSQPLLAHDRPFRQTHRIAIEVECLQTATEIVRGLNGYNIESSVFFHELAGRRSQSVADFSRRVDAWAFRQVQEELRALGIVHSESEQAQFLGAQITDLDVRIATVGHEIDRLTILMAASDTLDLLLTIESRIMQLIWQRNSLMGSRNVLVSQATSPVINIRLFENPIDAPLPEPEGFRERVSVGFENSWRSAASTAVNFFVFLVRISLPLAIVCIIIAFTTFMYKLTRKRHKEKIASAASLMPKHEDMHEPIIEPVPTQSDDEEAKHE